MRSSNLARKGADSKRSFAWTDSGKSGLKKPTKAWRMNGRLTMSVGPASEG